MDQRSTGDIQRLGVFYLVSDENAEATLDYALRFTHRDRFPALPGYKTLTSHWHWGYTIQALAQDDELGAAIQAGLTGHGYRCRHDLRFSW